MDQENAANLGGQAFWLFGGIFLVDSPEQRRMRVKDSFELAWNDWQLPNCSWARALSNITCTKCSTSSRFAPVTNFACWPPAETNLAAQTISPISRAEPKGRHTDPAAQRLCRIRRRCRV